MRNLVIMALMAGLFFSLYSCTPLEQEQILGQWQGVSVKEEGVELDIDSKEIQINFMSPNTYTYQSTLNYREAGSYHLDKKYLYTIDTLNQASTKKAVEILLLSEDSLHLRMMEGDQERVLKMVKQ